MIYPTCNLNASPFALPLSERGRPARFPSHTPPAGRTSPWASPCTKSRKTTAFPVVAKWFSPDWGDGRPRPSASPSTHLPRFAKGKHPLGWGREIETTRTTLDNFSKVRRPNRAADKNDRKSRRGPGTHWERGRPARDRTKRNPIIFHNLTPPSWEVRLPVAPLWMESGREEKGRRRNWGDGRPRPSMGQKKGQTPTAPEGSGCPAGARAARPLSRHFRKPWR